MFQFVRNITRIGIAEGIDPEVSTLIKQVNAQIVAEDLPKMQGYQTGLHVVFQHLITNAIKYR